MCNCHLKLTCTFKLTDGQADKWDRLFGFLRLVLSNDQPRIKGEVDLNASLFLDTKIRMTGFAVLRNFIKLV